MRTWLRRGLILLVVLYPVTTGITIGYFVRHRRIARNPWKHARAVQVTALKRLSAHLNESAAETAKPD